jgi:hypothetical protein
VETGPIQKGETSDVNTDPTERDGAAEDVADVVGRKKDGGRRPGGELGSAAVPALLTTTLHTNTTELGRKARERWQDMQRYAYLVSLWPVLAIRLETPPRASHVTDACPSTRPRLPGTRNQPHAAAGVLGVSRHTA